MKTMLWSEEDKDLMRLWITEHPMIHVNEAKGNTELEKLFPLRSRKAIYQKWRVWVPSMKDPLMEEKRLAVAAAYDPDFPLTSGTHLLRILSSAIIDCIKKYVDERVEILTSDIRKENADMKVLLQKMAKLREAVKEFKL